jgi:head-tail adaptor
MELTFNISELDTLVTMQRCMIAKGPQGEKRLEYVTFSRVWAKVERNITEMVSNSNLEEDNTIELTCYKIPELNRNWRVQIDGVSYAITAIDPVSRVSPLNVITLKGID